MSRNRKTYIDQLLSDLELLKERILLVKESDTLPFSFFSASFDRIEKISRSLHELELMQIGEMKAQMEQLVKLLSEQPKQSEPSESLSPEPAIPTERTVHPATVLNHILTNSKQSVPEVESILPEQGSFSQEAGSSSFEPFGTVAGHGKNPSAEKIILPEYKDPRINETASPPVDASQPVLEKDGQEKMGTRSLNDAIQAPHTLLDLRKGLSLNDRFLFQRELFNNNRSEMDKVMELLNSLSSYDEAENYLRSEQGWNLDTQIVKEFLMVIKKGFK